MRALCFYFQVHQPFRLRTYRFFDIGTNHYYYDDYQNKYILNRIANKCYLPTNEIIYNLIKEYGCRFKVSFSISGCALEQFEMYAPDVLKSFQQLASTGCVEFLAETYSHSLSSLINKEEFYNQVRLHKEKVEMLFGKTPKAFRNTELIYSDEIGEMAGELGFNVVLTEGAKHVLGWKSPNYVYCNAKNPRIKLLLKNYQLSDDIAFRFSNRSWNGWPLTADKYVDWLNDIDRKEQVVNLFMDYETFGEHQWPETGIFDFLRALPKTIFEKSDYSFVTPSEVAEQVQPVGVVHVPYPISWADEERDVTAWLGNELQTDAFNSLYQLRDMVYNVEDPLIHRDWKYLQTSDHFYYMCTKWFSDGDVHKYFNPYNSPYEAYINYMNILSDFKIRLNDFNSKKEDEVFINVKDVPAETVSKKRKSVRKQIPDKILFEDIVKLPNISVKKIIKNVGNKTIAIAMLDSSYEVIEKISKNLSKRDKKEIESFGDLRKEVDKEIINEKKLDVLNAMKKLYE